MLTKTVIVPSKILTKRKLSILEELEEEYKKILLEAIDYGLKNNVSSFTRLKAALYYLLRDKYQHLPSHYVYTALQDTSTRLRSFKKLKKRGLAKSDKPEVKKVSIWLDDHLWKPFGYTAMKFSTHKGRIALELEPHKLFWKYVNSWIIRDQPKIKIDKKKKRAYVYFVFEKEITVSKAENGNVISVDINESNVTVKVQNKVCILETDIKKITLGYASYKEAIQSVKGNGKAKRAVSNKEKQKKKDRRYKIANLIANTAKKLDAVVVLENLPKNCPRNMIKDVWDEKLRHRIYQAGFRSVLKAIEEKCLEKGVSFVKVNPKGTSSVCLNCGLKLMRGDAPRQLKCKCGFVAGRDVVAVLNLERTFKGLVPLGPMPDESTLEIAVLSMKEWMRRKSVDANDKKR